MRTWSAARVKGVWNDSYDTEAQARLNGWQLFKEVGLVELCACNPAVDRIVGCNAAVKWVSDFGLQCRG